MGRKYYSIRKGLVLDLPKLKIVFNAVFSQFWEKQYFVEAFGFNCVDAGLIPGLVGERPDIYFLRHLRKTSLWPIDPMVFRYTEDDLFDVIELTYDLVSKPVQGRMHSYNDCGMHWDVFDRAAGRGEYHSELNDVLADYSKGFELTADGEIVEKVDTGLEALVSGGLPELLEPSIRNKMEEAVRLFRRRHSTLTDRHGAVRMLADIFEKLRPELGKAITKNDEKDLFNIANNFAIRHDNDKQKTRYDKGLWLSWMFYFYLATLHYATRKLIQEKAISTGAQAD
jgi:hypothetical protein